MSAPSVNATPVNRRATLPTGGPAPAVSIQIEDIAYAVFRHKWKIAVVAVIALAVGVGLWFSAKSIYASDAKVMIRYVVESRSAGSIDPDDRVVTPDSRSSSISLGEMELLRSGDLAAEVAAQVGATNILRALGGGASEAGAAAVVEAGLEVNAVPKTSVLRVTFRHPDPGVARDVVRVLIERYLRLHARVHGSSDQLDDLARQYDRKRTSVNDLEMQLQTIKTELSLTSPLADALRALAAQEAALTKELMDLEAQLAEAHSSLAGVEASPTITVAPLGGPAVTNRPPEVPARADPAAIESYQALAARLDTLRKREQELLLAFSSNSVFLRPVSAQIADTLRERNRLVEGSPGLTNVVRSQDPRRAASAPATTAGTPPAAEADLNQRSERARIAGLEARRGVIQGQLDHTRTRASLLAGRENTWTQIQRRLAEAENQYTYFSTALERARAEEAVATSRLSNISVIESASAPYRAADKSRKIALGVAAVGPFLGVALAVLLELFGDSTLRRRQQIADKLGIPLFVTVPRLAAPVATGNAVAVPGQASQAGFSAYAEALRDRVIMHFQIRGVHHKPKMIGVTSCGRGAGVTSVATSLAASMSETGEGKVLYVDLNPATGPSLHPFKKGREVAGIDDALGEESRTSAMINDQLYAVSLVEAGGGRVGVLPRTISELVPRIRASDYDYIIFDLPPVTQTSLTARVAGLLDLNVLVLESEKTLLGRAEQAVRLLSESHSHMVAVLNKHRRYLPKQLDADL